MVAARVVVAEIRVGVAAGVRVVGVAVVLVAHAVRGVAVGVSEMWAVDVWRGLVEKTDVRGVDLGWGCYFFEGFFL